MFCARRKLASPSAPPKPPTRVAIGCGLGAAVRPASDSVASERESPARSRAKLEASVVPPRMRTRIAGSADDERAANLHGGALAVHCRHRRGWRGGPRAGGAKADRLGRAGGGRQAPSWPGRRADPRPPARLAKPDRRGAAGDREASRSAGRRAGERRSLPLRRRRSAAAFDPRRGDALPAAILVLQPGGVATRLVA